jgi:hypothetical protein
MKYFVVPTIGTGAMKDGWRPKYIAALSVAWHAIDIFDSMVVAADTTSAQDASISANADAILVPPLDNTVSVTATKNALESINVPAHWVTAGMTYRQVLRVICGFGQLLHQVEAQIGEITLAGNLDKTLGQLSASVRTALAQASDNLGLDRSTVTGTTLLRDALKVAGQQLAVTSLGFLPGL